MEQQSGSSPPPAQPSLPSDERPWRPMKVVLATHPVSGQEVRAFRGYNQYSLQAVFTVLSNLGINYRVVDDAPASG